MNGARDDELTAEAVIEVDQRFGEPTVFTLDLPLTVRGGDLPLLTDPRVGPGGELAVVAAAGGQRICLVWGPVTGQRITLVHGGTGSRLTVHGADASLAMAREDRAEVWADGSDSGAVATLAARYGFTADVAATATVRAETGHALVQREPDLALVRRLARRNGYCAWLTSAEQGTHTLHFRPPPVDQAPAAELSINTDPPSVESLEITWDTERPAAGAAAQLDPRSKKLLEGRVAQSPLAVLGARPYAEIAADAARRTAWLPVTADDAADLHGRLTAEVAANSFFARATGTTTDRLAGGILRAPSVVRLRGAGSRHSGPWLCARVRHRIDETAHTMQFELVRNGWGQKT
ncbi:phage late control D family protein [Streptomyces sp. NPDC057301]|uniref:phage late control D family protein n=1 Tax=Streptomyces sp. NPDC057301 TaxID=3346093 RepID=UPI0036318E91